MPHLDAAYNLARWLVRGPQDAEDVAQEACLRAFTFFDNLRGGDARPWLLAIVRNTSYSWLRKNRRQELMAEFDEREHAAEPEQSNPEAMQLRRADIEMLRNELDKLPPQLREVLVLREIEELSYRDIAEVTGLALGTVMSRLSRARRRLMEALSTPAAESHA